MTRGGISTASSFGSAGAPPQRFSPAAASQPGHAVECWTSTAADVEAWLSRARPGDRFVYAKGPQLVQGAAAALVGRLREAGDVSPHNRRDSNGALEFIIVRCAPRPSPPRPRVITPPMVAVLMVVQDAAENGARCPSDAAIGEAADLSPGQVKWALDKLADAKMIERRTVPVPGDARFRVIKVIATGCETRGSK